MRKVLTFVTTRIKLLIGLIFVFILGVLFFGGGNDTPSWVTDTVSSGTVSQLISISGNVDAVGTAELTFPTPGILESVSVKEGDVVTEGQILATLAHDNLKADYQDAEASLRIAQADLNELINGLSPEERDVSKTTAEIATEELTRVTNEQNERVASAYRTLLSTDLEAFPENKDRESVAPIITGTYTCGEGAYIFDTYNSNAGSGYSYRLSGLESGTFTAYTDTSGPLGTCGLSIQFISNVNYGTSRWTVPIPNIQSSSYVTNQNAYNLAVTGRNNAIREAEQKLLLAKQNLLVDTATPRDEARARAEARVLQAEARLSVVGSQIKDAILTAPFGGVVTNVEPVVGETISSAPAITMVSEEAFALTALVPEIDITKIAVGQKADVVFDARRTETLSATITFISPLAEEIDGVSYFEAKLTLDNDIDWLRSGLNADIDIIVEKHENVTRIPKRYLVLEGDNAHVLTPQGETSIPKSVEVVFTGNDGFVEVRGLTVGDTIVAP